MSLSTASRLAVSTKTIPLANHGAEMGESGGQSASPPMTTTIADWVFTVAPTAVVWAGTTLNLETPDQVINETLMCLKPISQLILDSKTLLLASEKTRLKGLTTKVFVDGRPFNHGSPSPTQFHNLNGTHIKIENSVRVFQGNLKRVREGFVVELTTKSLKSVFSLL